MILNQYLEQLNLSKKFGQNRVFDVPTSENALTGIAVGYISGIQYHYSHQRLDFSLLSMDQIVNSATKWRYMFGGKLSVDNNKTWFLEEDGVKVQPTQRITLCSVIYQG